VRAKGAQVSGVSTLAVQPEAHDPDDQPPDDLVNDPTDAPENDVATALAARLDARRRAAAITAAATVKPDAVVGGQEGDEWTL
jgi:hypothetical protein